MAQPGDSQPGNVQPPPEAALLLGLIWWVWVAIGVGCLVVVLLMVFVIVLCKRIKRRKVSQDNKPGNLLMLLCRLRIFVWMQEDVLLRQVLFFSATEKISNDEEWPTATEAQEVLPV